MASTYSEFLSLRVGIPLGLMDPCGAGLRILTAPTTNTRGQELIETKTQHVITC